MHMAPDHLAQHPFETRAVGKRLHAIDELAGGMLVVRGDGRNQAHAALEHVHHEAAHACDGAPGAIAIVAITPRLDERADGRLPELRQNVGEEELLWRERRDERVEVSLAQQAKDDRTITSRLGVTNPENLHFNYKVTCKGDAEKPQMVFDDGEKTYIRFAKASKRLPALFIREKGHKSVSLANFKVKDNTYMLDRLIDQAELRFSDEAVVSIKREK